MRIVDTGLRPARWNVAMTAALAQLHAAGRIADTLRFHRYPASVLLGRSQDMEHAADTAYCRRVDIEMARRVTGGGAVFMSPRMLAWDVVIGRSAVASDLEAATCRICKGVASGLSRFAAPARFCPPNDIEMGGRKVSGSSGYIERRSAVLQGTVLIADDMPEMARALRLPEAVLRERVTCLAAAIGQAPPVADVAVALRDGLMQALDRTPVMDQPSAEEMAAAESLLQEDIGTEEFLMGTCAKEYTAWRAGC
jgi:lipoate-protein ligase A